MTDRHFIKIRNILLIVLVFNWLVALAKIIYGYASRCNSMIADGFHSFSDGASNVIGIIGIMIASSPADREHPYGHKKYETFASVVISILLFLISFNLIRDAMIRFARPIVPQVNLVSFAIILSTIAVNMAVFKYERKKSKELGSDILFADSEHTRSDILVSISVIFTLLAIKAGFPMIDTIVSLGIAVLIAKSGVFILRATSRVLCDRTPIVSDKIREIVMRIEGVKDCHKIRTRGRLDDVHVDMHVLLNPSMNVDDAHNITERIEKEVTKNISGVTDVVVHVEPR